MDPNDGRSLAIYLLSCIIVAGIYGGLRIERKIPLFQSLPAAVALRYVYFGPIR